VLYRHALESIFSFLSLAEMGRVMAVSRRWSEAVESMGSIGAFVNVDKMNPDARQGLLYKPTRLARHVASLTQSNDTDGYAWLTHHCPPPLLTDLSINISVSASTSDINSLILAVSRIPRLEKFSIQLQDKDPLIRFAPLAHAHRLHTFRVHHHGQMSETQVKDLRTIPTLVYLDATFSPEELQWLLQAPCTLDRLNTIRASGQLDMESKHLLQSLPMLTDLWIVNTPHDPFFVLRGLEKLQKLTILATPVPFFWSGCGGGYWAELVYLSLSCLGCNGKQLGATLAHMPNLKTLQLSALDSLDSLAFLASSESLKRNLTKLSLYRCTKLRAVELSHVFRLQQLSELRLVHTFADSLDSLTRSELALPSWRLPKLLKARYEF